MPGRAVREVRGSRGRGHRARGARSANESAPISKMSGVLQGELAGSNATRRREPFHVRRPSALPSASELLPTRGLADRWSGPYREKSMSRSVRGATDEDDLCDDSADQTPGRP